jgi:hypothetical protein
MSDIDWGDEEWDISELETDKENEKEEKGRDESEEVFIIKKEKKEKGKEGKEKKEKGKEGKEGKEREKGEKTKKTNEKSKAKTRKEPGLKNIHNEKEKPLKLKNPSPEEVEPSFWNTVNNYYQLKNKYQKDLQKLKDAIDKDDINYKKKIRDLVAPCANCRRFVGTDFRKVVKGNARNTTGREFLVRCGDRNTPCPLNIHFLIPGIRTFDWILEKDTKDIDMLKNDIIASKNDLLFDYENEDDVIDNFKKIKEDLNDSLNNSQYSLDIYNEIANNPETREKLELKRESHKTAVDEYKQLIEKYSETKNNDFLKESMRVYISTIQPLELDIRELAYGQAMVETEDETYRLVQHETPFIYKETIDRIPVVYENLMQFIFDGDTPRSKSRSPGSVNSIRTPDTEISKLKKTDKKITIIPSHDYSRESGFDSDRHPDSQDSRNSWESRFGSDGRPDSQDSRFDSDGRPDSQDSRVDAHIPELIITDEIKEIPQIAKQMTDDDILVFNNSEKAYPGDGEGESIDKTHRDNYK